MKKEIYIILALLFLGSSYFSGGSFTGGGKFFNGDSKANYSVLAGGFRDSRDFTIKSEDIFIAFKNKIQIIEKSGKSYTFFEDRTADIRSIEYYKDKIYLINNSTFSALDIQTKEMVELIKRLPNFGDYPDCKLMVKDDKIYIAIGAATNSGIVGDDNAWKDTYPFNHDISPKNISLAENINGKTGAFLPYNTKSLPGQKVSGHLPGNASVMVYSLNENQNSLFCWGIRNVKGMDFDSKGKIYAAVGGMEPRGDRAVKGDVDYIYELKADVWYGWPDFSGGDPITSPRFKGSNSERLQFLLQNHPSNNPPAPIYQHKTLSSLSALVVDKQGVLGKKDCIYFYDNLDNIIYALDNKGIVEQKIKLDKAYKIKDLKIIGNSLLILEENEGLLLQFGQNISPVEGNGKIILIFVTGLVTVLAVLIIWRLKSQIE
ncbi:hypothetical protein [Clostridium thermarum]|uniref:hypothetical protein n=1 Tax=Clostridium thermarum TaxID=1716543 RepID=UPI00112214EB|nr:hypothetical protein [Clostridium thermarum]